MTTLVDIERAILWAAIEDVPALWSLVDEVQSLVADRGQAAERARVVTQQLVRNRALTVLTAPTVEGDTTLVDDARDALRLIADDRWWRTRIRRPNRWYESTSPQRVSAATGHWPRPRRTEASGRSAAPC